MPKNTQDLQDPRALLRRVFGFDAFRGRQAEVVEHIVGGGSGLLLMPTGGGKSLCYQVPALLRPGMGLVVSPLIALMRDQVGALRQAGVRAEVYNSTLDAGAKAHVRQAALEGALDILYVAPETLNTDYFQDLVRQLSLSVIAVDEAHCVSQWGHDFRPEYLQVAKLREIHPQVPFLACTATADPLTRREIQARLGLESDPIFSSSFDRPNIQYQMTLKDDARQQLLGFIKGRHANEAGIVYCLSRKKVEETAEWLTRQGIPALPYHAGMGSAQRQEHQDRFQREDSLIICATIAFGMGIDKPDVRFVAHLDLPKSVESYYQETGRAGRDGAPADAWMTYGLGDVVSMRQLIDKGEGSPEHKRLGQQKLNALLGLCESVACRRQSLLNYFGETHAGGCGNCDNCLETPSTWDGTDAARKALSAVARAGERFGTGHLIDILLGKETDKTLRFGHATLSVWGIGKDLDASRWSSVYRQLAAAGYLDVDAEAFGALKLNERSWTLLKGAATVAFRVDPVAKATGRGGKLKLAGGANLQGAEAEAFQVLRALRLRLAQEQSLPPYVVFHDATLREMIARRPISLAELARVPGVGEAKLERYGAEFISELTRVFGLVARNEAPGERPQREKAEPFVESLRFFKTGLDVEAVALARGLTAATVWTHLSQAIESGHLRADEVLALPADERDALLAALTASEGKLKPVFDQFDGKYPYEALKIVRAGAGWD